MKKTYFTPHVQTFLIDQSDVLTVISGGTVQDIGGNDLGVSGDSVFRSPNQ